MSLLSRILIVVGLALVILTGLHLADQISLRHSREAEINGEALRFAYHIGAEQDQITEGARQLLITLAQLDVVRNSELPACTGLLSRLKEQFPIYSYLGVADATGKVTCSSNFDAGVVPINVAIDQPDVQSPQPDIILGTYARLTYIHVDSDVLQILYPISGPDGRPRGYVRAGLNLAWLNHMLATRYSPSDVRVLIADEHGTIVGAVPDGQSIGHKLPAAFMATLDAKNVGTLQSEDVDGKSRVYGYIPIDVQPSIGVYLAAGVDASGALFKISRAMWRDTAILVGILILASLGAWLYVVRFIRAPLAGLLETANRWRAGDWTKRAARISQVSELDRLAIAFNAAADTIQARDAALGEAKKAAEKLGDSFRLLFDSNPAPMMVFDRDSGAFIRVNDSAVALYGYDRQTFESKAMPDVLTGGEASTLSGGVPEGDEPTQHCKADGNRIFVRTAQHELSFEERNAVLIAVFDVTDAVHAAAQVHKTADELRRSQEHLAIAQHVSGTGSIERNLRTGKVEWSEEARRIFVAGMLEPTSRKETFFQLIHPDDKDRVRAFVGLINQGITPPLIEFRIIRPDGVERIVTRDTTIIFDEEGRPSRVVGSVRDVTDQRMAERRQKQMERKLEHSQRLESLGTLAGGIAHDLNNMLVPILALAKVTKRQVPADSHANESLDTILRAGERARNLVQQILTFSRQETGGKQSVDIAAVLRETLNMLRAGLPSTIDIVESIGPVAPVLGDPGQLQQVILNLVTNAAQAIGENIGTISVSLNGTDNPAGSAGEICLGIGDDGCGMDGGVVDRIFEPFFTTKPVGEGTGLGLAVVHGVVASHGGRISVSSQPGRGTLFTILLPSSARQDQAAA